MLKNYLMIIVGITLVSATSLANQRQHQIKLIGQKNNQIKQLTVEQIEIDIKNKVTLKTSLQGEPVQTFEGVSVKDFVEFYAPAKTKKMKITAINNYSQTLTEQDWNDWMALLAYKSDGKIIATKSRGTFRVIYDYEKYKNTPNLVTQETNSVWQITEIQFLSE